MNLHIIEPPIVEKKLVKTSRLRKLFRKMLVDVKNKKYDEILAWNPNRLARNMMESGEIINMVDEGVLCRFKVCNLSFPQRCKW